MSQPICAYCSDRIRGLTRLGELVTYEDKSFHRKCLPRYKAAKFLKTKNS